MIRIGFDSKLARLHAYKSVQRGEHFYVDSFSHTSLVGFFDDLDQRTEIRGVGNLVVECAKCVLSDSCCAE